MPPPAGFFVESRNRSKIEACPANNRWMERNHLRRAVPLTLVQDWTSMAAASGLKLGIRESGDVDAWNGGLGGDCDRT